MHNDKPEMKSMIIHRSYFDAVRSLPTEKERWDLIEAILSYGLDNIEPKNLSQISAALFGLMQPTIEAAKNRYLSNICNGKKGGRPPKTTIPERADKFIKSEVDEPINICGERMIICESENGKKEMLKLG